VEIHIRKLSSAFITGSCELQPPLRLMLISRDHFAFKVSV